MVLTQRIERQQKKKKNPMTKKNFRKKTVFSMLQKFVRVQKYVNSKRSAVYGELIVMISTCATRLLNIRNRK